MANVEALFWADGDTDWGEEFRVLIRTLNVEIGTALSRSADPLSQIGDAAIVLGKLSTAVQASLAKADASLNQTQVDARAVAQISAWVGAAPDALNTLIELASRIESESSEVDALVASIATKVTTTTYDAHVASTSAHGAVSTPTASTPVRRDASGRAQVADPVAAADIATKGYVDGQPGARGAELVVVYDGTQWRRGHVAGAVHVVEALPIGVLYRGYYSGPYDAAPPPPGPGSYPGYMPDVWYASANTTYVPAA